MANIVNQFKTLDRNKKIGIGIGIGIVIILIIIFSLFLPKTSSNLKINKSSVELVEGDTFTFTLDGEKESKEAVIWKVKDTNVATVDRNGKVTAVKEGKTTVEGTYASKSYEAQITVKELEFTMDEEKEVKVGEKATITYKNNSSKEVNFESQDTEVATVNEKGEITGVKKGETKVVGTVNDKKLECTIKVVEEESKEEKKKDDKKETSSTSNKTNSSNSSSSSKTNTTSSSSSSKSNSSSSSASTSKPSSNNSSTNSSNSGSSSNNTSSKPASQPTQPSVSYSYYGQTAYNYLKANHGTVASNGGVYVGAPDTVGLDGGNLGYHIIGIDSVKGTPDCDYVISYDLIAATENHPDIMRQYFQNICENGSEVFNFIQSAGWPGNSKTIGGRTYTVSTQRTGYKLTVSARKN